MAKLKEKSDLFAEMKPATKPWFYVEVALASVLTLLAFSLAFVVLKARYEVKKPNEIVMVDNLIGMDKFTDFQKSHNELNTSKQPTSLFRSNAWVVADQMFVQNTREGGWLEWTVPGISPGKKRLKLYLTKAGDYGIVQVSVNGNPVGQPIDLFSNAVLPVGPIDIEPVEITESGLKIRLTVTGHSPNAWAPFYQMGIQGLVVESL